jgi:hypothetical protein
MHGHVQTKSLLDDCHQHVDADGDPDLRPHGVFRSAVEAQREALEVASMALRWTAAAMHEAKKGFRRLKAFKQLPALRAALTAHYEKETTSRTVAQNAKALRSFTAALAS